MWVHIDANICLCKRIYKNIWSILQKKGDDKRENYFVCIEYLARIHYWRLKVGQLTTIYYKKLGTPSSRRKRKRIGLLTIWNKFRKLILLKTCIYSHFIWLTK